MSSAVDSVQRFSPVHAWFERQQPQWGEVAGMPVALRVTSAELEAEAIDKLAICDLSCLRLWGVKGSEAQSWLEQNQIERPPEIYDSCDLADGALVVRLSADEFILQTGINDSLVTSTFTEPELPAGVYPLPREEATFLLTGKRGTDALGEACGVDVRHAAAGRLVMTRVAGCSCSLLPGNSGETWTCRIWVDYCYAAYLWEALVDISESLGGHVIGVEKGSGLFSDSRTVSFRGKES